MPATIQDKKNADLLFELIGQQQSAEPQGDLKANLNATKILAAQKSIAKSAAFLESTQDELFKNAVTDVSKLKRYNQIRRKFGAGDTQELPAKIGVVEELGEQLDAENIPFVGGVFTVTDLWNAHEAALNVESGKATLKDWEILAAHMQQAEIDATDRTFFGGVARIGVGSLPFWIEFAASGGLASGARIGATTLAKKAVKKSLSKVIGGAAIKVASIAGMTALKLPVFSHRIAAGTARRMMPQFATIIPEGEDANVEFVVLDRGEGALEAAKNAIGDVYIEVFSEQTGDIVGLIGGPLKRLVGMKPGRIGAREFLRKFGINSIAGEIVEERIGEGLRETATRLGALNLPQELPTGEQLLQEGAAFALPIGGANLASSVTKNRPTLERVKAFAQLHPEQAKKIAAIEGKVSRKKLKAAAGDALSNEEAGKLNRDEFRDQLKNELEQPQEAQTPQEAQAATPQTPVVEQSPEKKLSQFGFSVDNPGGKWLDNERKNAKSGTGRGAVTASSNSIPVEIDKLLELEGQNKEQERINNSPTKQDKDTIDKLTKDIKEKGFTEDNGPLVWVDVDGKATIAEGNHRLHAAKAAGLTTLPVQFRWFAGSERSEFGGAWSASAVSEKVEPSQTTPNVTGSQTQDTQTPQDTLQGPEFRPNYTFKSTKEGKEAAKQLKEQLPEGLQSKVRIVKKGNKAYKNADGNEVLESIGMDKMAQSILTKQIGKPKLANPADTEEGRNIVRASDEIDVLSQVPEKRRDTVVKQEADARLQQDFEGERAKLLQVAQSGGQLSDTDTAVAKAIIRKDSLEAALSGDKGKVQESISLISAYRRSRKETARALRQGFDPNETPKERRKRAIVETLLTPNAQVDAQINKHLDAGEIGEAEKLQGEWAEQAGELIKDLERAGINLSDIDEILEDDVATARLLGIMQAHKASGFDAIFEYWRNSILSAPSTQGANIIGNTTFSAWHFTAERITEGIINTVVQNPNNVQWGEFKYLAAGILPGLSKGVKNFFRAWNSETPSFELSLRATASQKIEEPNIAIPGKFGRGIRTPQRMLLAFDELYKSLFTQMDVGAQAYRIAKADGLKGPKLQERISQLMADTQSAAWDEALKTARKLTFQTRDSKSLEAVLTLRKDIPGARYLVPFVTTPWNIFGEGLRRSPVGVGHLVADTYRASRDGNWSKVVTQSANQLIAWSAVLMLMDNDPDDPWITGAAAGTNFDTRQQAYRTHPTQSIKVGDTWYSYARVEPMATWLSLAVDVANSLQSDVPLEAITKPLDNLAGQIQNKTFMQGLGDIVEVTQRGFDPDALGRWSSSFITSWVPNIFRKTGNDLNEFVPERKVWGESPDKIHRWIKRIKQKTGLAANFEPDQPKIDLWGRPARKGLGKGLERNPQSDFWWRVMVPISRHTENIAIGDRLLMNWNSQNPDDEHRPAQPRPYFTINGDKRWMNDREYGQFLELSGRLADFTVQREAKRMNIEKPTESDIKVIEKILTRARKLSRNALMQEWSKNSMADRDPNLVNKLFEIGAGNR